MLVNLIEKISTKYVLKNKSQTDIKFMTPSCRNRKKVCQMCYNNVVTAKTVT